MAGVLLITGLAHATQDDGAAREAVDGQGNGTSIESVGGYWSEAPLDGMGGHGNEAPLENVGPPLGASEAAPLPRFTVGWYCPAPRSNPLPDLLGFGLGVLLIWGMAARRKARDAQRI